MIYLQFVVVVCLEFLVGADCSHMRTLQCFFITASTFGGAIYFKEFHNFTPIQAIFFPIGVLITLGGVYILSNREMSKTMSERKALEVDF